MKLFMIQFVKTVMLFSLLFSAYPPAIKASSMDKSCKFLFKQVAKYEIPHKKESYFFKLSKDWQNLPKVNLNNYQHTGWLKADQHFGNTSKGTDFPLFIKEGRTYILKTQALKSSVIDYNILSRLNIYGLGVAVQGVAKFQGKWGIMMEYHQSAVETNSNYLVSLSSPISIKKSALKDMRDTAFILQEMGIKHINDIQFLIVNEGRSALLFDTSAFRSNLENLRKEYIKSPTEDMDRFIKSLDISPVIKLEN